MIEIYRLLQSQIESSMNGSGKNDFCEISSIVDNKSIQTKKTVENIKNQIGISIYSFLASHIHMMINRQYSSKQRIYELIIYDHL